jgi:hypothetical protein
VPRCRKPVGDGAMRVRMVEGVEVIGKRSIQQTSETSGGVAALV